MKEHSRTELTDLDKKSKLFTRAGKVHYFFEFELDGNREIHTDKAIYDLFSEGALIYVEIAENSKYMLKVEAVE